MQEKLIINGVDFIPAVIEGGIQQSSVTRQEHSVTGLDGTLYPFGVRKRAITVSLLEMRTERLRRYTDALSRIMTVEYTDREKGPLVHRFVLTAPFAATTQTIVGGNTYVKGGTFSMEEM